MITYLFLFSFSKESFLGVVFKKQLQKVEKMMVKKEIRNFGTQSGNQVIRYYCLCTKQLTKVILFQNKKFQSQIDKIVFWAFYRAFFRKLKTNEKNDIQIPKIYHQKTILNFNIPRWGTNVEYTNYLHSRECNKRVLVQNWGRILFF